MWNCNHIQQQTSFVSDTANSFNWFKGTNLSKELSRTCGSFLLTRHPQDKSIPIHKRHKKRLTLRLLPWSAFGIVVGFVVGQFATFASRHGSEGKPKISKTSWIYLLASNQTKQIHTIQDGYYLMIVFVCCCSLNWYVRCFAIGGVTVGRVISGVSCHATLRSLVQNTVGVYAWVTR